MKTTLVINPKGGSGKTTIAINLAACLALDNLSPTLMDYEPGCTDVAVSSSVIPELGSRRWSMP